MRVGTKADSLLDPLSIVPAVVLDSEVRGRAVKALRVAPPALARGSRP
jgi:hypothetical protein